MKKTILIVLAVFACFLVGTASVFGIQHHYKQVEIREAEQRIETERLRKVRELKDCQAIIGVLKFKLDDEERSRIIAVSGDLEKTRQQLLLICENRKSYWAIQVTKESKNFDEVTELSAGIKREGRWNSEFEALDLKAKNAIQERYSRAQEQQKGASDNYEEILHWVPSIAAYA